MTIETWKAKYYPTSAKQLVESGASELDCVRHSLIKWHGLSDRILAQHHLAKFGESIAARDPSHTDQVSRIKFVKTFEVVDDSCALCVLNSACDCVLDSLGYTCGSIGSPYRSWLEFGNVEPMLTALRECEEVLKNAE